MRSPSLFGIWATLCLVMICVLADSPKSSYKISISGNFTNIVQQQQLVLVDFTPVLDSSFKSCMIQLVEPVSLKTLFEVEPISCKSGHYAFSMPNIQPAEKFFVRMVSAKSVEGTSITMANATLYKYEHLNLEDKPVKEITLGMQKSSLKFQDLKRDYYYDNYYRPEGAEVWIDGNPTYLYSHALMDVYWTGVESYVSCMIELVADNSATLYVPVNCAAGHRQFMKVNMPASVSAFIKLSVLDEYTYEEEFYFTTWDSFGMEADE